jgi:hypothetical protein
MKECEADLLRLENTVTIPCLYGFYANRKLPAQPICDADCS